MKWKKSKNKQVKEIYDIDPKITGELLHLFHEGNSYYQCLLCSSSIEEKEYWRKKIVESNMLRENIIEKETRKFVPNEYYEQNKSINATVNLPSDKLIVTIYDL